MAEYIRWLFGKNGHAGESPIQEPPETQSPENVIPSPDSTSAKTDRIVYIDEPNTWIINDGLLRDEGVLFGLSGADATEKIASINSYYEQLRASHQIKKNQAEEKQQYNKDAIALLQTSLSEKENLQKEKKLHPTEISPGKIIRYLLGFIVMGIAAYGSFYLLHFFITPLYGLAATLGIFFFGLFAQMTPVSSWLEVNGETVPSTRAALYKEYLLEIGPAVAATLLAAYLIYKQSEEIGLAFMIGVFLLFLFFFNGKLILGLSQTLVQEVKKLQKVKSLRKESLIASKALQAEISDMKEKESQLLEASKKIVEQIEWASIKLDELNEERNNKVKLFMSEYRLANHFTSTTKLNEND